MNDANLGSDDIIHVTLQGDIAGPEAKIVADKIESYIEELHKQNKKAYFCIFIDTKGDSDTEARKIWVDLLKKQNYEKIAFWGGNIFTENVAKFVLLAAGIKINSAFFDTEEKAHAWLKN